MQPVTTSAGIGLGIDCSVRANEKTVGAARSGRESQVYLNNPPPKDGDS